MNSENEKEIKVVMQISQIAFCIQDDISLNNSIIMSNHHLMQIWKVLLIVSGILSGSTLSIKTTSQFYTENYIKTQQTADILA